MQQCPPERYKLAPYVAIGYDGENLKFGFGSIQKMVRDNRLQRSLIEIAEYLLEWRSKKEIQEKCESLVFYNETEDVYSFLKTGNFLIKDGDYDKNERYSRHALFYRMSGVDAAIVQSSLQKKSVAVVGCGGIGNLVAITLATAGIGTLVLVDDDVIELSNLTRQIIFDEDDVGQSKTETLERALLKRSSSVKVKSITARIDHVEKFGLLPRVDMVVVSGDSSDICVYANDFCFKKNIPFIHVGYIQEVAVWGPMIVPGKTPCYKCFKKNNISDKPFTDAAYGLKIKSINNKYQSPSFGPVNMLAASHASMDILKYLGSFGSVNSLNRRIGVWTNNLQNQTQTYKKCANCICIIP